MYFHLNCEVLLAEKQKLFKIGKIRNCDKVTEYFGKKNGFILKNILSKMQKW